MIRVTSLLIIILGLGVVIWFSQSKDSERYLASGPIQANDTGLSCVDIKDPLDQTLLPVSLDDKNPTNLKVGIAAKDITPTVKDKTVYLAGFGQNRKATGVHDRLYARAIVFESDKKKIAMVSVDLVGFFYENVLKVRKQLAGFDYVLVSSTHNHEGPDTLGLWGSSPFKSGMDPEYMKLVESRIVEAVKQADKASQTSTARIGTTQAPELLHDGREPFVKHDTLVAMEFMHDEKRIGILVQWNCHPETLSSKNTEISADYVTATVEYLKKKYDCPVVYFTGTVGGLMTSLHVPVKDDKGKLLRDGTWEKTKKYGILVGQATDRALKNARAITLTPITVKSQQVFIPLDNKLYQLGRQLGVLRRKAFLWNNDPYKAKPAPPGEFVKRLALRTEIGSLHLGEVDIAAIPGEIYPELVLDKVQNPADPNSDYPKAPIEPAIYKQLNGKVKMLIGLANDEIGYIIPKRQWDHQSPYCYGRKKNQYGEVNSVGPESAPILCNAFQKLQK